MINCSVLIYNLSVDQLSLILYSSDSLCTSAAWTIVASLDRLKAALRTWAGCDGGGAVLSGDGSVTVMCTPTSGKSSEHCFGSWGVSGEGSLTVIQTSFLQADISDRLHEQ